MNWQPLIDTFDNLSNEWMYVYEYASMIDVENESRKEIGESLEAIMYIAIENMQRCENSAKHFEEGNRKLEQIDQKNNKLFTR